jgi:hypothetical protein
MTACVLRVVETYRDPLALYAELNPKGLGSIDSIPTSGQFVVKAHHEVMCHRFSTTLEHPYHHLVSQICSRNLKIYA